MDTRYKRGGDLRTWRMATQRAHGLARQNPNAKTASPPPDVSPHMGGLAAGVD